MTHELDDLTDEQRANAPKWAFGWLADPGAPDDSDDTSVAARTFAKALLTALVERDSALDAKHAQLVEVADKLAAVRKQNDILVQLATQHHAVRDSLRDEGLKQDAEIARLKTEIEEWRTKARYEYERMGG